MTGAAGGLTAWGLLLAAARVGPLVLIAPAAAGLPLPRTAQVAIALVVAALVAGGLGDAAAALRAASMAGRLIVLARELLIGVALGVTAAVPLLAASAAGGWLAAVSGDDDRGSPWGIGLGLLAAVVFFGIGGHLAAVSAVGLSYRALPVGGAGEAALAGSVVDAGAAILGSALVLAAPLLVTAVLVALAAAVIERAAGLATSVAPEAAVRRLAILLAAAAAIMAIAIAVAGDTRALPATLAAAIARLAGR
ncbi:MAG TPA: flagellar biosynthetic protein FliR [Kofleriaceae bacterium]|nr:flagellar biosynthetic protein FliR [Kofleriaceae bacterium]